MLFLSDLSSFEIHDHDILHHARQIVHPEPLVYGIPVDVPVAVVLVFELEHEHMAVPLLQTLDADVPPTREGTYVRSLCDGGETGGLQRQKLFGYGGAFFVADGRVEAEMDDVNDGRRRRRRTRKCD